MNTPYLSMSRYRSSRNWAIYNGPELPLLRAMTEVQNLNKLLV